MKHKQLFATTEHLQVTQSYDRCFFEVHQKSENGKWYRVRSSDPIEGDNADAVLAKFAKDLAEYDKVMMAGNDTMQWMLGEEFTHKVGTRRLVRVTKHVEVLTLK